MAFFVVLAARSPGVTTNNNDKPYNTANEVADTLIKAASTPEESSTMNLAISSVPGISQKV